MRNASNANQYNSIIPVSKMSTVELTALNEFKQILTIMSFMRL